MFLIGLCFNLFFTKFPTKNGARRNVTENTKACIGIYRNTLHSWPTLEKYVYFFK